jgi:hypothetical protein
VNTKSPLFPISIREKNTREINKARVGYSISGQRRFPKVGKLTATKWAGTLGVDVASPIPHVVSIQTLVA